MDDPFQDSPEEPATASGLQFRDESEGCDQCVTSPAVGWDGSFANLLRRIGRCYLGPVLLPVRIYVRCSPGRPIVQSRRHLALHRAAPLISFVVPTHRMPGEILPYEVRHLSKRDLSRQRRGKNHAAPENRANHQGAIETKQCTSDVHDPSRRRITRQVRCKVGAM